MTEPQPKQSRTLKRLRRLWQMAIEPAPTLKDPLLRHRARLLNSLMVIFLPLAILTLIVQQTIMTVTDTGSSSTVRAITMGIAIVALIYVLNRAGFYRFTSYFTLALGFIAIMTNAIASDPPHVEIAYLIMLPLFATLLLSLRETLVITIATIIILLLFNYVFRHEIPLDIMKDLLTFIILTEAFIVFVSHHRNRLEIDRQQLVIERERNDLLNQLINNLSHDFRTPLTVINTSLYLLKRVHDPRKQREKIEQIEQQTQQLNKLIDAILTISQLDHGQEQTLQPVQINELLQLVAARFRQDLDRKSVTIQFNLSPDFPAMMANYDQLERALMILLENAVHYTENGAILLRTCQQPTQLMVEIGDTGIGIAEADLPFIFDRFYRADSARSTYTGGTGLGLAIVRRVVELHGGQIEVESTLGQGSHFRLLFPPSAAGKSN